MSYLNKIPELIETKAKLSTAADLQSIEKIDEALAVRSASIIADVMSRYAADPASNEEKMTTLYATEIIDMTTAHVQYLSFKMFKDGITNQGFKCPDTKFYLNALCKIYGLTYLRQNCE